MTCHEKGLFVVALTGSSGSGKSTVSELLSKRGASVLNADELARKVVAPGTDGFDEIVEVFGTSVVDKEGGLDRRALAHLVFHDRDKREKLEAIIHPRVQALYDTHEKQCREAGVAFLIYEIPLLFEAQRSIKDFRAVVVVTASRDSLVKRIQARDGITQEEAQARLMAQLPEAEKIARADFVVENNGDLSELERASEKLWQWLQSKRSSHG